MVQDNIIYNQTFFLFQQLVKGEQLLSKEWDFLLNIFTTKNGIDEFLEDEKHLQLLSLAYRCLHDLKQPIRPKVLYGNFYLSAKGRLFSRTRELSELALTAARNVSNFDFFSMLMEQQGVDMSLEAGRMFPPHSNWHYPDKKDKCSWCSSGWNVNEDLYSLRWEDLGTETPSSPEPRQSSMPENVDLNEFVYYVDSYKLLSVDPFLYSSPLQNTMKDFRKRFINEVFEKLPGRTTFQVYSMVCDKPVSLRDYFKRARLVTDNYRFFPGNALLARITFPVHRQCLLSSLKEAEQRWAFNDVWHSLTSSAEVDNLLTSAERN